MKYALIKNNIVEQTSYPFVEGWEEVSDNICAGMIKKTDGTFDYTDEVKQKIANEEQEKQDEINKKTSGKQKLLDLGLTEEEVKALIGI
jgi:phosphosulfolactate phosphohydrolase-like enzyme